MFNSDRFIASPPAITHFEPYHEESSHATDSRNEYYEDRRIPHLRPYSHLPTIVLHEVANMSLPWVLGAGCASTASEENCIVIQLVGAVLDSSKRVPQAGCFALLRWGGKFVAQTPLCRNVHAPTWHEQVCECDGYLRKVPKRSVSFPVHDLERQSSEQFINRTERNMHTNWAQHCHPVPKFCMQKLAPSS